MVSEDHTAEGGPRSRSHTRRRWMTASAVALFVVVSLVVIGAGGPGAKDAAAQVELGARTTLDQNSVALTYSGSITVNGDSIPLTGTGLASLSSHIESSTLSFSADNEAVQETVLMSGTSEYMEMTENGQNIVQQLLPGKQWVQLDLAGAPTSTQSGTTSVLGQLQLLTEEGNKVVPLGSSSVDGQAVTGYQVTLTAKAIQAAEKRLSAEDGAPTQLMKSMIESMANQPPVLKLWIGSNHLLVRESVSLSIALAGESVSGAVNVDFSNYGGPVTVSVPSSSVIGSYSAFLAAAKAAG